MQKQITEHDKKLIVFLLVFVIVVGAGYWGVFPIVKEIMATDEKIEDAKDERFKNELKVAELPMIEAENERMEEKIQEARSTYFPIMTSDQVDKYMTEMMLGYDLYAYDLDIDMPTEEAKAEPYKYSVKASEETSESDNRDENGDSGNSEQDDAIEAASTGIYAVSISMRVGGKQDDIQKMIDDLSASDTKMQLTGYEWDSERSISYNEDGEYEVDTDTLLNMDAVIYMCVD